MFVFPNRKIMTSPAIQATNLVCSEVSDTQLQLTIERGNGRFVLITGRLTATTNVLPSIDTSYTPSTVFGSGEAVGTGVFALYVGSDDVPSILVTGLTDTTSYTFQAYEFNIVSVGTEKYNTTSATGNPVAQLTLIPQVAPSTQSEDLVFLGDRRVNVGNIGDGIGRLIVYNLSGTINAGFPPLDANNYSVGDVLGGGNIVGAIGTESGFDIPIMPFDVTVAFKSYEYNIASGDYLFNTANATNNPISSATPASEEWFLYHETPVIPRKDFGAYPTSRATHQNYPTCHFDNADFYFVFSVSEGADGQDRTIRYRKDKTDGLPITQGWTPDSPVDALGDVPSFLDGTNRDYDTWDSGTTYADDEVVRRPDIASLYQSLGNSNVGVTPWINSTAGTFVVGIVYQIVTAGTTNFTLIGAANNNVGTQFTATGVGSGTGTAKAWQIVTLTWDQYQCWAMSYVDLGSNNGRLYYTANAGNAQRYSVGFLETSDGGLTFNRYASNPVLTQGSGKAYYYGKVVRVDASNWYLFVQNYNQPELQGNHLYVDEIHHSTDGIAWTIITSVDIFSGRNIWGAVDVGQPWVDGTDLRMYMTYHNTGVDGYFVSNPDGDPSTFPVGIHITEVSCPIANLATFNESFVFERVVFTGSRSMELDHRTWCHPIVFDTTKKFVWHMSFTDKFQTLLAVQNEPFNCGKMLTTDEILTEGYQFVGNEAFPSYIQNIFIPHQSWLNDTIGATPVQPIEWLSQAAGTIVGAPTIGRLRSAQAVNNGFVTFANFAYDPQFFSVAVMIGMNNPAANYGICGMDNDVAGQEANRGWRITHSSQYFIDFFWYASDFTTSGKYKHWRLNYIPFVFINSGIMAKVGFVWRNGSPVICFQLCTDCFTADPTRVTKIRDDVFTDLQVSGEVLRVGAVFPTINDEMFSQDIVGPVMTMSGTANATEANWNNHELM